MNYDMSAEKIGNHVKPSPLISVVIPAYQAVNTIKRAVDSVLSIPLGSIEVIVVDDGSTDGTTEVLSEISASDTRLRVVRQDNSGRSVARNSGFGFSSGKWVMFLDADDYLLPGAFRSLIERAENSTADLVVFGMKKAMAWTSSETARRGTLGVVTPATLSPCLFALRTLPPR